MASVRPLSRDVRIGVTMTPSAAAIEARNIDRNQSRNPKRPATRTASRAASRIASRPASRVLSVMSSVDVADDNTNENAFGDDDRMRNVQTTLNQSHWNCVPEYKEAQDKRRGSASLAGKKNTMTDSLGISGPEQAKPKNGVMKKKSDKNLKALAVIQTIAKSSHFSSDERIHLATMFQRNFGAEKHPGLKLLCIDSRSFQRIMHATFGITNEKIIEGLFRAFDFAGNNIITEPEWIRGLSLFVRGKFEERLEVVWTVYDTNEDGSLSREEMYTLLQDCLVKTKADDNDTEEAVKDLVEMLFRKLDVNHDGKVDKEDFWSAVKEDNLLLECCGQVFPSQRHVDVFEATFADGIAFKPT